MCATPWRNGRSSAARRWALGRLAVAIAVTTVIVLLGGPPTASAHTGFDSSLPADGEVVADAVGDVTIVFTGPAIPVGDKFTALDPNGTIRVPSEVTSADGSTFVLTFDPPLSGGQVGIKWSVKAPDAHPIDGSFAFTVTAPPAAPVPVAEAPVVEPAAPLEAGGALSAGDGRSAVSLEEFLATDSSRPGETIALVGRIIGLSGVVFALGGLVFMASTLRGTRDEIRVGLTALRVLGGVVATGAVLEFVGLVRSSEATWIDVFDSPGLALMLRIVGGLAIAGGIATAAGPRRLAPIRSLSSAVLERPVTFAAAEGERRLIRWSPRASTVAMVGAALIVISFWFDGHTVSRGPRIVHGLLNSVHVVAGSVWAGGVVAMAVVAWSRYRRGQPTRAAELAIRFSSFATVALVAVGLAGAAMAVLVLDSVGQLTGTEWGRILLLKTGAVALAAAGGAYNHFRLLPALQAAPDDEELATELRSTITAEAIVLAFVVMVTAWLVAAAS